ncbi:MAG: hypothetical protein ACR2PW_00225 [Gammaproteobacteria bacterium]
MTGSNWTVSGYKVEAGNTLQQFRSADALVRFFQGGIEAIESLLQHPIAGRPE